MAGHCGMPAARVTRWRRGTGLREERPRAAVSRARRLRTLLPARWAGTQLAAGRRSSAGRTRMASGGPAQIVPGTRRTQASGWWLVALAGGLALAAACSPERPVPWRPSLPSALAAEDVAGSEARAGAQAITRYGCGAC